MLSIEIKIMGPIEIFKEISQFGWIMWWRVDIAIQTFIIPNIGIIPLQLTYQKNQETLTK